MRASTYHVLLRIGSLTLALVLAFDSGLLFSGTKELSQGTQAYMASVIGASASVERTDVNVLTAELSAHQRDLDAREAALTSREISIGLNTNEGNGNSNLSTYLMSIVLFIIVVLMVLNYALDFARDRRITYLRQNEQAT
jgi:hypothetical protein